MKLNRKSAAAMAATFVLILSLLAGCGAGDEIHSTPPAPESSEGDSRNSSPIPEETAQTEETVPQEDQTTGEEPAQEEDQTAPPAGLLDQQEEGDAAEPEPEPASAAGLEPEPEPDPSEGAAEDGTYTAAVLLEGGSGRATVESPAVLRCENGKFYATIVWSSPNFDYMKVDGVQYDPIQTEGNSTFELPVAVFDQPMAVIADTVAMSEPHEVEYALTFDSATLQKQ